MPKRSPGIFFDRRHVQAALVGERTRADVCGTAIGRHVQPIVEQT